MILKKIFATLILIISISSIVFSIDVIFMEETPEVQYPALETIRHNLLGYKEETILLKSEDVKVLQEFAKERYLADLQTKLILVFVSLVSSILALWVLIERKNKS
jgi:hypothetical protein